MSLLSPRRTRTASMIRPCHHHRAWHHAVRTGLVVVLCALTTLLSGCGADGPLSRLMLKPDHIIQERVPDPAYDKLFPYYVELCATSQLTSKDKGAGGVAGHAVMYIKGACKDDDAPFPQLRRCRRIATEYDDPEHGAGISVGRWFRNVNWVAVPGYKLFYQGNLEPGQRLTREHWEATLQEAIDRGVFRGVELQDFPSATGDRSLRGFMAQHSIGTDFALQFARSSFCARMPITEPMLDEVIAFLNDKNTEYATGEADYNWSLFADNCVHTLRNALAAANIWSPLSVRQVKLLHLFQLAVPANEFVNLAQLGTGTGGEDIGDYRQIQREDLPRDAFYEFFWRPTQPGALVKTLPVHEPNDIYDTSFRLFTLQSPFRMGKTQAAIELLSDPAYVDLGANLQLFHDRYAAILDGRDARADMLASVRGSRYRRVERLYYDYVAQQKAEVDAMLARLPTLEAAATPDGENSKGATAEGAGPESTSPDSTGPENTGPTGASVDD